MSDTARKMFPVETVLALAVAKKGADVKDIAGYITGRSIVCDACAAAVACVLTGRTGPRLHMDLPGGSLDIEWDRQAGHVLMTGPANITFTGTFFLKD